MHGFAMIWILSSSDENNILRKSVANEKNIVCMTRENKIHIFKSPCNILFTRATLVAESRFRLSSVLLFFVNIVNLMGQSWRRTPRCMLLS